MHSEFVFKFLLVGWVVLEHWLGHHHAQHCKWAESTQRFIEGQAFFRSYDSAPRPPSLATHKTETTCWRESPFTYHSILSFDKIRPSMPNGSSLHLKENIFSPKNLPFNNVCKYYFFRRHPGSSPGGGVPTSYQQPHQILPISFKRRHSRTCSLQIAGEIKLRPW